MKPNNPNQYDLTPEIDPDDIVRLGREDTRRMLDSWIWLKLFQLRQLPHTPIVKQAIKLLEAEQIARDLA